MQENNQCQSEFSTNNIKDKSAIEFFQLLSEGENATCNLRPLNEATLIFGNSGSGKTTFTRRIAGYGSTLRSVFDKLDLEIISLNSTINNNVSFMNSNNKFPQLVQDERTGASYYDFPGFNDTSRGAARDIATMYFIKKTIDNVEQAKMLVLVDFISFTKLGTEDDLASTFLHITKFVKNIEKYKDSVALIVTKVPYPETPDDTIISSIAQFIEQVERDLRNKTNPSEDYSEAIKLINIILQKERDIYPKIGISRSPNSPGLLNEIPLLNANEEKIKTKLAELKFVKKDDTDFSYTIPKQSLVDISNLVNQIYDSITASVREIGKEIQKYISAEEDRIHNINQFLNFTNLKYNELGEIMEKANTRGKIETCIQEVVNGVASLNINSACRNMLIRYGNYSTFLHQVTDNAIDNKFKCADGLQDIIKYSFNLRNWYHFLDSLYERLSSYDIQSNIPNSPCAAFATQTINTIQNETNAEFKFNLAGIQSCYPKYEAQLEDIKDVMIDKPKLNAIEKVLNSTMMNTTFCSCNENKLVIKGHFLKLDDILHVQKAECRASPKFIEIFALNEIFINSDLNKTGEQVQLSIIAPVWNIQGNRKITLDGEPGQAIYPTKATGTMWSDDGEEIGQAGQAGFLGGPGGTFIGIGDTFKNLQGLTVSVRGGNGGKGQDGADGADGRNGKSACNDVYVTVTKFLLVYGEVVLRSKRHRILSWYKGGNGLLLAGEDGEKGVSGGDGGSGGSGGNSGKIMFAPLSSSDVNDLHTVTGMGTAGSGGKGGRGGVGGSHGNNLYVELGFLPSIVFNHFPLNEEVRYRYGRAEGGYWGRDGAIGDTHDDKNGEESGGISNLPDIINEYVNYATENLQKSPRESYLTEFLNKLKNDMRFRNTTRKRRHITMSNALKPSIRHVPVLENQHTKQFDTIFTNTTSYLVYAKNAGVRVNSPINFAASLVSNFFGHWKLFGSSSIFNYGLVKSGMELLFGDFAPLNIHASAGGDFHRTIKPASFNINESLTLVDFTIRCITKKKIYNSEEELVDLTEVTATALNIIAEFEEILSDMSALYNLPPECLEIDPITLISKLERELINQNCHNVSKILCQSIESDQYAVNSEFRTRMLGKIDEMLEKQGKHHFKIRRIKNGNFESRNRSNVIKMESFIDRDMYHLKAKNLQNLEQISTY